jgi:alpha/beta superfamily hydrolase
LSGYELPAISKWHNVGRNYTRKSRKNILVKKYKIQIILILILSSNLIRAQELYSYEKKVSNIENYISTEIESKNTDANIIIKGTLIEPKKNYNKIIIVVPGSGKDTRNSHYKLTEQLLTNNIAVFRYDERGCGLSSGTYSTVSYSIIDMTNDLKFVFQNLKNEEKLRDKKIGILGHSLGGMVSISLLEKNINPDFLIQWATPVQSKGAFLKYQLLTGVNKFEDELIFKTTAEKINVIDKINNTIFENRNDENLTLFKKIRKVSKEIGYKKKNYKRFTYANFSPVKAIIKKDFEAIYKKSPIAILYIIGTEDKYVESEIETELLKSFNNSNIVIKKIEGLNHYLNIGSENIENMYEIDNKAVTEIINWTQKQ